MRRLLIFAAFCAAASLITPMAMNAGDKRYYDRDGRDYHTWNDHEDRAYRVYLNEQHREYRDFRKAKAPEQKEYFRWRHEHPDNVIFKVEIR
jgi:hypothetical protein